MGLTTTCRVGVDLETMTVLVQSTVISFGLLLDCARAVGPAKSATSRRNRVTVFPPPKPG
jgi:hypothetical protein